LTHPLVGLVIVSHSRPLARAAIELAAQMLPGGPVAIEEAAGLEDGSLGTDAVRVAEAIVRADGGRGVVVLADLGSAVLSAELAVELLDPALRERVTLSPGPLVEGLCVAAVAAAGGAGRDEVAHEAATALAAKQEHTAAAGSPGTPEARDADLPAASGRFEVTWPEGLHARPAAVLVRAVRGLEADVRLANLTGGGEPVPAASLAQVAALGAAQGQVLEVTARGRQAGEAVGRVLALALRGFGTPDSDPAPTPP